MGSSLQKTLSPPAAHFTVEKIKEEEKYLFLSDFHHLSNDFLITCQAYLLTSVSVPPTILVSVLTNPQLQSSLDGVAVDRVEGGASAHVGLAVA